MLDTQCPECGFGFDPTNESRVVCPACGADPNNRPEDDPGIVVALEYGAAFMEVPVSMTAHTAASVNVFVSCELAEDGKIFFVRRLLSYRPSQRQRQFRAPLRRIDYLSGYSRTKIADTELLEFVRGIPAATLAALEN